MAVLHHPGGAIAAMQRGMYLAKSGWFWALFGGFLSSLSVVCLVDLYGFY